MPGFETYYSRPRQLTLQAQLREELDPLYTSIPNDSEHQLIQGDDGFGTLPIDGLTDGLETTSHKTPAFAGYEPSDGTDS